MDDILRQVIKEQARRAGLRIVTDTFYQKLDWYLGKTMPARSSKQKQTVAAYLASAAMKIAKEEKKSQVEGEDVKAAIWYFHTPTDENDPCVRAADQILRIEQEPRTTIPQLNLHSSQAQAPTYELEPGFRSFLSEEGSSGTAEK